MSAPVPMTEIRELTDEIIMFRESRNWRQFHTPKNLIASLGIEVAELAEIFQWKGDHPAWIYEQESAVVSRVAEESADVAIYLLTLCHGLGIDLATAIRQKLDLNEERYPIEKCQGRPDKWTAYR